MPRRHRERGAGPDPTRPWATMPEDELLKAVLARDTGAWSGFFYRYERLIISCIKKVLHRYTAVYGDEDIEDMVSTVCLNLVKDDYRKLRTYDASRGYKLSSWVGLIATNTAHDALRRREPIHQRIDDHNQDEAKVEIVDTQPNPGERMERTEEWTALLKAIQDLPDSDRQFLELYYDHEYEPEEIARRLGISVNTVYSRKNKVREKLRRLIEALDAGKVEASRP